MKQNNFLKTIKLAKFIFLSTIRNPSAVFFSFMFPFMFIIVFGLIGQGFGKIDLGVSGNSIKTGIFFETLKEIESVNLVFDKTEEELARDLEKGSIGGIIQINNRDELTTGVYSYLIELKTSSAAPQEGATLSAIINSIKYSINENANQGNTIKIVDVNISNIEGRKYQQIDFILPGQLSFSLLSTGVFNIAFVIIALRKTLVLKRMFATPTPKWTLMLAKVLSSLAFGALQVTVIVLVGHFAFNFTLINGFSTFIGILLLSLLGLIVFLGLGLFVSSLGNNEDAVSPIANLLTMPQLLLSGSFFPIDTFPAFLQPIAKILPMTFLNDAMRAIAFEGATFQTIIPQIFGLIVFGIIIYGVTIKIFKWE